MIRLTNISHQLQDRLILNNIELTLEDKQVIALIGPNGAGKSTLFSVMARLQPLQSGRVSFGEHDIASADSQTLAQTVAMLSQENHVQGRLRVHELLMFGRYPYHQGRPSKHDHEKVAEIIERFELGELSNRFYLPSQAGSVSGCSLP